LQVLENPLRRRDDESTGGDVKKGTTLHQSRGNCSPIVTLSLEPEEPMIGFSTRVSYAIRCFFSLLFRGTVPQDIARALAVTPEASTLNTQTVVKPKASEKPSVESFDRAVQMLALLQRDGRLIDFLTEDVSPYADSQLGAAVRTIHASCRQVLDRYVKLEPVISSEEDQPVTVPVGFDPAAVKLLGNIVGEPPIKGMLRHRGWRVKEVTLPFLPQGAGREIIAPAEVEIT
jgi:hypothetical protein